MQVKIFSIWDSKGKAFAPPFYSQTTGTAIRSFTDAVNEHGSPFNKYPDDFTLFELGAFDDADGKFHLLKSPESVGNALQYIHSQQPQKISAVK